MTRRILAAVLGAILLLSLASLAMAANTNGSGGDMPAYYDGKLFTINFKELPPDAEKAILAHGGQFNTIWMCDQCESSFMFVSVLDAIQGDGFNPLWREVQIQFLNPQFAPRQFFSDTEIMAAAATTTANGQFEITLVPTDEVYRCSVVGPKKK